MITIISFGLSLLCMVGMFGCPGAILVWVVLAILSAPSYLNRGGGRRNSHRRYRRRRY